MELGRLSPQDKSEAKLSPTEPSAGDKNSPDVELDALSETERAELSEEWGRDQETALIAATRWLLSRSGASHSEASVRELPENRGELFSPQSAVSALVNAGFTSNFGKLPLDKLTNAHCPAIAFRQDGAAVIVEAVTDDGGLSLVEFGDGDAARSEIAAQDKSDAITPYVILAIKNSDDTARRSSDWFWAAFKNSRSIYAQVILATLLSNILGVTSALFIMVVYDRIVPNNATESLVALTLGVLIALGFDFSLKTLKGQFIDRAGQRADRKMSRQIFDKIMSSRLDRRTHKAGAMASIVREFETLKDFFTSATLVAVVDLPFIVIFLWVISKISGPLTIIPAAAVPIVVFGALLVQPFLSRVTETAMKSGMSKQGVLVEALNGLETIQATGSGGLMRKRFENATDTQSEMGLKSRMLTQLAINMAASTQQLVQVLTVFYGVFLISDGTITMGAMIAAMILGGRAISPLGQVASALSRLNAAREAYKNISKIMNADAENEGDIEAPRLSRPVIKGQIELQGVTYQIPSSGKVILKDISLKIPAGQKVAVVGRMGSGKSTLLRVMSGLILPSTGSVLFDGVDLRQIDKADVRKNIGVMLQDSWLFSGSIKENIQMGFYEYDDAHILDVAKISGVDDFVSQTAEGYDLDVRERGEALSGGQRQSINLARALLNNPNTLLMDEPTSSMDTGTEAAVVERMRQWGRDKTMVMVTHRNKLLEIVDRVLVVDRGTIVADTTPEQLKRQSA